MLIIDSDGAYQYEEGTKKLATSEHPVWQARIELALPKGDWLYAPDRGHNLKRFQRVRQTASTVDEFKKEVAFYLSRYEPAVKEIFVNRDGVSETLEIDSEVLSANG